MQKNVFCHGLPGDEVRQSAAPTLWSFMNESRRLTNVRLKRELKVSALPDGGVRHHAHALTGLCLGFVMVWISWPGSSNAWIASSILAKRMPKSVSEYSTRGGISG
jgi:hypothetical protein